MSIHRRHFTRKGFVLITILLIMALFWPVNALAAPERIILPDEDSSGETMGETGLVLATKDGGQLRVNAVLAGSGGGTDISLTKMSKDGRISWSKSYGGSGDEQARSIQETSDNGFIITGYTSSQGTGGRDLYMLRLSPLGEKKWETAAGDSLDDEGIMVQQTSNGDFVAVGYSQRQRTVSGSQTQTQDADIMAVRYDRNGKKLWQKYYGGDEDDYACSIQTNKNGGLVIAGCTRSYSDGTWDIYVIKTIDSGLVTWERSIGGTANYISTGIQQTPDNGYLVMGYLYDTSSTERTEVRVRMDSSGTFLWQQNLDDASLYGNARQVGLSKSQPDDNISQKNLSTNPPPQKPEPKKTWQGKRTKEPKGDDEK